VHNKLKVFLSLISYFISVDFYFISSNKKINVMVLVLVNYN